MPAFMPDNDSRGHWAVLLALLESDTYREFWMKTNLPPLRFETLGLPNTAPDLEVSRACQERQIILITSNRNAQSPDSLENTIRRLNDPSCLPVITIANRRRLRRDKAYAQRAVERLPDYVMDLVTYRGTGRLDIP